MKSETTKTAGILLLLLTLAILTSGCIWWGPRRPWRDRREDGGRRWHPGYYDR